MQKVDDGTRSGEGESIDEVEARTFHVKPVTLLRTSGRSQQHLSSSNTTTMRLVNHVRLPR